MVVSWQGMSQVCWFWRMALFSSWPQCPLWIMGSILAWLSMMLVQQRRNTNLRSTVSAAFKNIYYDCFSFSTLHNLSLLCLLVPLYPVPPDIRDIGLLSNVSVVMNQPTNLLCDVTGTPVPVITWYKDEVEVSAMTFTENHMVLFCVTTACDLERK